MSEENTRGGPHPGQEGAPPTGRAPCLVAPWCPSDVHLLLYELLPWKKNHKQAYGRKLRHHEAEPWRNQSRALAELFCRGNFPPGGENHHQRSSHREGVNLHQHLHSTISSQTLVHLLYPILVSKFEIGTCRLLVVLITPYS